MMSGSEEERSTSQLSMEMYVLQDQGWRLVTSQPPQWTSRRKARHPPFSPY